MQPKSHKDRPTIVTHEDNSGHVVFSEEGNHDAFLIANEGAVIDFSDVQGF